MNVSRIYAISAHNCLVAQLSARYGSHDPQCRVVLYILYILSCLSCCSCSSRNNLVVTRACSSLYLVPILLHIRRSSGSRTYPASVTNGSLLKSCKSNNGNCLKNASKDRQTSSRRRWGSSENFSKDDNKSNSYTSKKIHQEQRWLFALWVLSGSGGGPCMDRVM